MNNGAVASGIGIGNIIAAVIGWSHSHSVLWTIIDAILGWLYVIWYVLVLR